MTDEAVPGRVNESDIRLIRLRLIAIEQERFEDARAIAVYLVTKRGLRLRDVARENCHPGYLEHWRVPPRAALLTALMDYGSEPVWAYGKTAEPVAVQAIAPEPMTVEAIEQGAENA